MKLFVVDIHDGSRWVPSFFWSGSLRRALETGIKPEYRIRRVLSRDEAVQLATHVTRWDSEIGEMKHWNLDTFDWGWPPARTA